MKKVILFLFFISSSFLLFSQEGKETFFTIKAGFTIPVAQSTIGSPRAEVGSSILNINNTDYSEKAPFGSRGAGGAFAASIGHMFMQNIGLELEFSFIRTMEILDAKQDRMEGNKRYFAEQKSYTNMFRAAPMIVVMGNKDMKVRPYAKFGVLIPLAGKTIAELEFDDETGELADLLYPVIDEATYNAIQNQIAIGIPIQSNISAKTSGHFSLGFTARVGAEIALSDRIGLFGELEMNMLTVKSNETEITDFYATVSNESLVVLAEQILGHPVQGEYYLEDIPEILRYTIYENELTEESNKSYNTSDPNYDRDNPYNQLTFRDNYNSFGFLLGMRYSFGKKSITKSDSEFREYQ